MPVPSTLADLDPVAANNSPPGSEAVGTNIDDYLRAHAAFIKQIQSGSTTVAAGIVKSSGTTLSAAVAGTDYQAAMTAASQAEMEAGTEAALRSMSPLRVKQAIDANVVTQVQTITASVGSNALTIGAGTLSLDFRSTTAGSGTVTRVTVDPSDLVISSGSTLGTVSGVASRIAVLAINYAGTIELAAVNVAGGVDLSETGVISTTAEGGAGAADSATTVYSTTARSNVAYRVIGYIDSTQATAGTWATAPSVIQGAGGQAFTAMSSLGYGQTWQSVTRTSGTTYYNTTGKPIVLSVICSGTGPTAAQATITINGVTAVGNGMFQGSASGYYFGVSACIPPLASYSYTSNAGSNSAYELR